MNKKALRNKVDPYTLNALISVINEQLDIEIPKSKSYNKLFDDVQELWDIKSEFDAYEERDRTELFHLDKLNESKDDTKLERAISKYDVLKKKYRNQMVNYLYAMDKGLSASAYAPDLKHELYTNFGYGEISPSTFNLDDFKYRETNVPKYADVLERGQIPNPSAMDVSDVLSSEEFMSEIEEQTSHKNFLKSALDESGSLSTKTALKGAGKMAAGAAGASALSYLARKAASGIGPEDVIQIPKLMAQSSRPGAELFQNIDPAVLEGLALPGDFMDMVMSELFKSIERSGEAEQKNPKPKNQPVKTQRDFMSMLPGSYADRSQD